MYLPDSKKFKVGSTERIFFVSVQELIGFIPQSQIKQNLEGAFG
jgi:hypothetical protein